MNIVSYQNADKRHWESLYQSSDDAWFWHSRSWWRYSKAFLKGNYCADMSFAVEFEGKLIALVSAMLLRNFEGQLVIGLSDHPVPWPAYLNNLSDKLKKKAEMLIYDYIYKSALDNNVQQVDLFSVVPAASFYSANKLLCNSPLRFGYVGSDFITHGIYLCDSLDVLWKNVRKGHKAAIKSTNAKVNVSSWFGGISCGEFEHYKKLHALAAGRVTRSDETFEEMKAWIRNEKAILLGANDGEQWLGFVLFIVDKKAAFYASAANHPDFSHLNIGHSLLWAAIEECKAQSLEFIEMGLQHFSEPGNNENSKLDNISNFKRGFGGVGLPRYNASMIIQDNS